jgi:uncharacterized membrane protein YozB (DUF420 family)
MVILSLKVAVAAVTLLLLASLIAIAFGHRRLHGRINIVFFILTMTTVVGFELLIRVVQPDLFQYIKERPDLNRALSIHLSFAIPAAILLPVMLFSGLRHFRKVHLCVAAIFGLAWLGLFVTGIFFLPHRDV